MLPNTISLFEETRTISTQRGQQNLTRQQFAIVQEMCGGTAGQRVVSFKDLEAALWTEKARPKNHSVIVRTQISTLRKLVAPLGLQIKNVRSGGYYFDIL